jgi:hypothetical protein
MRTLVLALAAIPLFVAGARAGDDLRQPVTMPDMMQAHMRANMRDHLLAASEIQPELAGASGDLGTLIPLVAAYVSVLEINPVGILLSFGVALIVAGPVFKTPFPVQPMKAIGAAAITQIAGAVALRDRRRPGRRVGRWPTRGRRPR